MKLHLAVAFYLFAFLIEHPFLMNKGSTKEIPFEQRCLTLDVKKFHVGWHTWCCFPGRFLARHDNLFLNLHVVD